jgi:hypothetical protein
MAQSRFAAAQKDHTTYWGRPILASSAISLHIIFLHLSNPKRLFTVHMRLTTFNQQKSQFSAEYGGDRRFLHLRGGRDRS